MLLRTPEGILKIAEALTESTNSRMVGNTDYGALRSRASGDSGPSVRTVSSTPLCWPLMPTDYLVCYVEAGEELRLHGLPERDPESVDVTNDELTHAVEGIIEVFHDLNPVLKA